MRKVKKVTVMGPRYNFDFPHRLTFDQYKQIMFERHWNEDANRDEDEAKILDIARDLVLSGPDVVEVTLLNKEVCYVPCWTKFPRFATVYRVFSAEPDNECVNWLNVAPGRDGTLAVVYVDTFADKVGSTFSFHMGGDQVLKWTGGMSVPFPALSAVCYRLLSCIGLAQESGNDDYLPWLRRFGAPS
jgi:hypothetical protein